MKVSKESTRKGVCMVQVDAGTLDGEGSTFGCVDQDREHKVIVVACKNERICADSSTD